MAERRMFAKTIVLSDAFLDMPMSARCLYFTLGMLADDDGFINAPKSIMRQSGATEDDLKILIAKRFVIPFESGVIVIKHWRINNYLQKDRIQPTKYQEELAELIVEDNGSYSKSECIQEHVYTEDVYTDKNSIGKNSIDKDSIKKNNSSADSNIVTPSVSKFKPPTLQDVSKYCAEKSLTYVNPESFVDFYESKNWMVGKNKMSNWKSALSGWNRRAKERGEKEFGITIQEPEYIDRPERWRTCPDDTWQKLKPYASADGSFDWGSFDSSVLTDKDREWMKRNDM